MQKTVWLENKVAEDVELIAKESGISFSKAVNQACKLYIEIECQGGETKL